MKPARLSMNLDVGESIAGFNSLSPEQEEAARTFFLLMSGDAEPEAREIWKLSSKLIVGGDVSIATPKGTAKGTLIGFIISAAKTPEDQAKLKEMLDRAVAIQSGDKKRGGAG